MLNIQEVVNFVNEKLNTNENITFNVRAEIGESDKESLINGILRTAQAKTTPIKDYVENKYVFVCELSVPTGRTNKMFLKVQDIVSEFADSYNGNELEFTNGKATINCSLGKPEDFKVAYNVGDCTPLYFTIDMIYTESGVMSIEKKWYLSDDGTNFYEIPYESESVVVNKEGITRKVDFDKYTKTFLTGQTKFYKFKFPYQNTTLGNMLMKDILNGDFKKQYTLKYVDGINYVENDLTNPPYTTKVSLFMSGDINSQVVNVGKFDVTFTDVDDGNTTTKYYIGLIDWKFDMSGEDTAWFASQADQQTYFNTKVSTVNGGTGWQQIQAPNLNSIYITSQVFPNTSTPKLNVFDLARKNYAIIKIVKTEGSTTTTQYIYYNATNCQIGANGQVTYDLKEDTVQTLLPDARLRIADSFITRCHLDRYYYNNNNTYSYNFRLNSPLFEREEIKGGAKRPSKYSKLRIAYDTSNTIPDNSDMNAWLNGYVSHWVYCFLSFNDTEGTRQTYEINGISGQPSVTTTVNSPLEELKYIKPSTQSTTWNSFVRSGMIVLAYPVLKYGKKIYARDHEITNNFDLFLSKNDNYARVYAIKNSIIPPFTPGDRVKGSEATSDYRISSGNLFLNIHEFLPGWGPSDEQREASKRKWGCCTIDNVDENDNFHALFMMCYQDIEKCLNLYFPDTETYKSSFTKAQAKENTEEPKIYNEDYSMYNIYYGGQTYELPISKSSPLPAFKYYEPITPDITKFYLAFYSGSPYGINLFTDNSVFNDVSTKDYTGLVGTLDLSMWFSQDRLSDWLSQNKNNLQIFQNNQRLAEKTANLNMGMGIAGGAIGGLLSVAGGFAGMATAGITQTTSAMGSVAGGIGGLAGIATSITNRIKTDWQLENEATNRELTIDNMRQSPSSLSALNSNAILLQNIDDLGVYLELQELIPHEKEQIKDYMKRFGYTVNRLGSLSKYLYDINPNTNEKTLNRKSYVYIKALISSLNGLPISTEERLDFKQRFESGIRFWNRASSNTDFVINYNVENYESYFDEEDEEEETQQQSGGQLLP